MVSWLGDMVRRALAAALPPPGEPDPDVADAPPVPAIPDPVARARSKVDQGAYVLGGGDYRPVDGRDEPWTLRDGILGSDCVGFALSWCHRIPRERPGYNRGGSVTGWLNTDSLVEDAYGVVDQISGRVKRAPLRELVEPAEYPWPGTLLVYAAVRNEQARRVVVGHIALVESCSVPVEEWGTRGRVDWRAVTVIQCRGPNGKRPGVIRSSGATWQRHDELWGLGARPWRASRLLRVIR